MINSSTYTIPRRAIRKKKYALSKENGTMIIRLGAH